MSREAELAPLLAEDCEVQRRAIATLTLEVDAAFALRSVLVHDRRASVRARAAERLGLKEVRRLGDAVAVAVEEALRLALEDRSEVVREAAARGLGRIHDARPPRQEGALDSTPALERLLRFEPAWRARRAAARALVDFHRAAPSPALSRALGLVLDDPFWRVRYVAVEAVRRALDLTCPSPSPRASAALALARGLDHAPPPAADRAALAPDDDPDPAVVTAALARRARDGLTPKDLVRYLSNPHDELRRLAIRLLLAAEDDDALVATAAVLDDPRVPYAIDAASRVLARGGTAELAARLADGAGTGGLLWALENAANLGFDLTASHAPLAHHSDPRVRAAFFRAAPAALIEASQPSLEEPDELARAALFEALLAHRPDLASNLDASSEPVLVGLALVRAASRMTTNEPARASLLAAARRATSPAVRAAALELLFDEQPDDARAIDAARDPDPWIRAATLPLPSRSQEPALEARALAMLEADPDPFVRRRAMAVLARKADAPIARRAVELGARAQDPWLRARAADLVGKFALHDATSFESLLAMSRAREPMARSAAVAALDAWPLLADRARDVLNAPSPATTEVRLAAHALLARSPSSDALALLDRDRASTDLSERDRRALDGMRLLYEPDLATLAQAARPPRARPLRSPRHEASDVREPADVAMRELGRTGVHLAPLVVSGAFELPINGFEAARRAGVNAFFWEPDYVSLSTFLVEQRRDPNLVVVAGSYEASPRLVERDLARALRRLRREVIDVFLLYWVRSPARLSDELASTLLAAQRSGRIRAFGFSTHLRDLATEASARGPWQVVMVRNSAAHPGAESSVFPSAAAHGVGVLAFGSLLYGRMLDPHTAARWTAADCYRYSLQSSAVAAAITAPRRVHELTENLDVLRRPDLDPSVATPMREHGERARLENRRFFELLRNI
ncbi:MAG: aldo/keto reductase [Polyangiaceae bacterium]